ncbi:MAG: hypothetical protein IPJ38_03430, partial [Dechloromonas sp.]|nr:hypothetical protein [Candidatus Dechloromonas phosphorivorans]
HRPRQPVVNMVRQPEFVAYLQGEDFSRPLTLRSERGEDRVLDLPHHSLAPALGG